MTFRQGTEEYYQKFIELQEKLRKSEEERLVLEMKFNEMMQVTRDEEQTYYRKLRSQYKQFLEENGKRQERNERILRLLERVETRAAMLEAKTQRVKFLRRQYQSYLDRIASRSKVKLVEENNNGKVEESKSEVREDVLKKYLWGGEERPGNVSSIADDIMHSIRNRRRDVGASSQNLQEMFPHQNRFTDFKNKTSNFDDARFSVDSSFPNHRNYKDSTFPSESSRFPNPPNNDFIVADSHYSNPSSVKELYKSKANFDSDGDTTSDTDASQNPYNPNPLPPRGVDQNSRNKLLGGEKRITFGDELKTESIRPNNVSETNHLRPESGLEKTQPSEIARNEDRTKRECKEDEMTINHDPGQLLQAEQLGASKNPQADHGKSLQFDENSQRLLTTLPLEGIQSVQNEKLITSDVQAAKTQEGESTHQILQPQSVHVEQGESIKGEESVQPLQSTEPSEQPVQCDENGQPIQYDQENDRDAQQIQCDENGYDQNGQPIQQDVNGQPTQYNDENGQPILYNENGQVDEPIYDKNTVADQYSEPIQQPISLAGEGQPIQYNQPEDESAQQIQYDETPTEQPVQYDESGQLNEQPIADEQPVQYDESGYDKNGQPSPYDEHGQPIQYDEHGQPIQYDEHGQPIQYDANAQPMQYDANGQPIQYDANGQPIQYDTNGQPINLGGTGQQIQYDENGQPIQYDESGQPIQYSENYQPIQYDENGQPIQSDGNYQPIQYDENGQAIQYDENGQAIQYDETGHPIQSDGQPIGYDETYQPIQYDEQGQPIQSDGHYDEHQQIQYDENGQPIQEYDQSQYDENGQLIQYDENGQVLRYDENGQLVGYDGNYTETPQDTTEASGDPTFNEEADPGGKKPNVLDLLETDTESANKQDTNKVSNDSDFDFSNNA